VLKRRTNYRAKNNPRLACRATYAQNLKRDIKNTEKRRKMSKSKQKIRSEVHVNQLKKRYKTLKSQNTKD
jgi:hypothetical protein